MEKPLHIKETDLELFAYRPESFNEEETGNILSHLDKCSLCKDIYNSYQNIYNGISAGLDKGPDENDKELADKIVNKFEGKQNIKLLPENKTSVQIFDGKVEIVTKPKFFSLQYVVYMVKNYPAQSAGFAIVVALALAFIVNPFKTSIKDDNPAYAEVNNGTLNVHNSLGEMLWKKPGYELPQRNRDSLMTWLYNSEKHVDIIDIDNDG